MAATGQVDSYCVQATGNGPLKVLPTIAAPCNALVPGTGELAALQLHVLFLSAGIV